MNSISSTPSNRSESTRDGGSASSSVTVVGGGVIGLSLAWVLAQRGMHVRLFQRGRTTDSTSRVAAGILPPANRQAASDPIDKLRGFSHQLFPEWAARLEQITGVDIELRRCGGWYLADSAGEQALMAGMLSYWQSLCIECQQVSVASLRLREPSLVPWLDRHPNLTAWWLPDEYQVRPATYLNALHAACVASNVDIVENASVDAIRDNATGAAVRVDGRWFESDRMVVSGGSWSGLIDNQLRLTESLIPIRGQILVLKTDHPLLKSIVNIGQRYVLCRDDGHTIIGSCEEEVGFDQTTSDQMIGWLRRFAVDLIPELDAASTIETCAGLRPLTFDGFPVIGRVPETTNLFVATGHYRSGIHLSAATATCLADLMTGREPPVDLAPFRVGKQQS